MWRNLLCLLVSIAMLAGCGFQLRGTYLVPDSFKTIYLHSASPYSELTRAVKKRFHSGQVDLINAPRQQTASITLHKDNLERKSLTLFADGQVAEYRLFYSVEVEIILPSGEGRFIRLQAQRDYLDDPGQALAKSREMEMLLQEMRVEIADQLLRKLSSFDEHTS